ncbi:MAG: hypothetical protein Q7S27_00390 [Nanoarchaeota archaeon]|nr:hypothetical protein [Nanoarchaeota archaeon]
MNKGRDYFRYWLFGIVVLVLILGLGYYFSSDENEGKNGRGNGIGEIGGEILRGVDNIAGGGNNYGIGRGNGIDVYPEVWSSNGPDGKTYEYKSNCGSNYDELEECFLWDVDKVVVFSPLMDEFNLNKDFNINNYSGEITRRWVLYGPSQGGLPIEGEYKFNYYKDGNLVLEQKVNYQPDFIDYPRNVSWKRNGEDLYVEWDAPEGVKEGMWYKIIVFPKEGNVISLQFDWNTENGALKNIPLKEGDKAKLNVAVFYRGGYAYSEYVDFEW